MPGAGGEDREGLPTGRGSPWDDGNVLDLDRGDSRTTLNVPGTPVVSFMLRVFDYSTDERMNETQEDRTTARLERGVLGSQRHGLQDNQ